MTSIALPVGLKEALQRHRAKAEERPELQSLEWLLTSPDAFGLTTATPVQRAICRILDGAPLGELEQDPDVQAVLGGQAAVEWLHANPGQPPEFWLVAGIRGAKSLIAAALAFRASQTCNLDKLGPGEVPRVSVLSVDKDKADVVLNTHLIGRIEASRRLRERLIGRPRGGSLMLRHPSGRAVEVKVVAGARAGSSLIARWSAGVIFDEATRMVGAEDGVVNLDDARRAVVGRLLPGAQAIYIGSAWAPFGPVYDMVQSHWGKPSREHVVVRAKGWQMNPVRWTPDFRSKLRAQDPVAYQTDGESEFADPESSMFADATLGACTRSEPAELPPNPLWSFAAAMDPSGSGGNAWTLTLSTCTGVEERNGKEERKHAVALTREWLGQAPDVVLEDIAGILRPYGVSVVWTDQWSADALAAIARRFGLVLAVKYLTQREKFQLYDSFRVKLEDRLFELGPDPRVRNDLKRVRKKVTQDGYRIVLPITADGRHCDFASSVVLSQAHPIDPPRPGVLVMGTTEWAQAERLRLRQQRITEREKRLRGARTLKELMR